MHQHRRISFIGCIGNQNTKFRMVAFIDIFKFYFIFVQTDCTKPERMGKRIISGVGCYFTIKFQINRTIRSVAVNTDFFIEMSDSLCVENGCYRTFSTGRYRKLSPVDLRTAAGRSYFRNNQRFVTRIREIISNGHRIAPKHISQLLHILVECYFRLCLSNQNYGKQYIE